MGRTAVAADRPQYSVAGVGRVTQLKTHGMGASREATGAEAAGCKRRVAKTLT